MIIPLWYRVFVDKSWSEIFNKMTRFGPNRPAADIDEMDFDFMVIFGEIF